MLLRWTVKNRVETLLIEEEATRNSDVELHIRYFQRFICKTPEEERVIRELFTREKIDIPGLTRRRAIFQNDKWLYLSSEQVRLGRVLREEQIRDELRNN